MSTLSIITLSVGVILGGFGALFLAAPGAAQRGLAAFPRHRILAWVLTAIDMVWVAWLLYHMPLGKVDAAKPVLFVLAPVAVVTLGLYMDELLAIRALGGLFLLIPSPMLDAARWHPSAWRYVVIVLAYAFVLDGLFMVVSPGKMRILFQKVAAQPRLVWIKGLAALGLGVLLVVLALTVFRRPF